MALGQYRDTLSGHNISIDTVSCDRDSTVHLITHFQKIMKNTKRKHSIDKVYWTTFSEKQEDIPQSEQDSRAALYNVNMLCMLGLKIMLFRFGNVFCFIASSCPTQT